jgi:hypothetical protein
MSTGSHPLRSMILASKRGKWLGEAAATLKKAIDEKNDTLFNQTYNDTMKDLHWKYREAQQLTLQLHGTAQHSISQLRLFAA